jgi:hypothetical protein
MLKILLWYKFHIVVYQTSKIIILLNLNLDLLTNNLKSSKKIIHSNNNNNNNNNLKQLLSI